MHSAVEAWLDALLRQGKSVHTIAAYQRLLAHFIRWSEQSYDEVFEPARVIPRDVRDWLAYQQTVEKTQPVTINQRLTALKRFFAWAVREGHASLNTVMVYTEPRLEDLAERMERVG